MASRPVPTLEQYLYGAQFYTNPAVECSFATVLYTGLEKLLSRHASLVSFPTIGMLAMRQFVNLERTQYFQLRMEYDCPANLQFIAPGSREMFACDLTESNFATGRKVGYTQGPSLEGEGLKRHLG